METNAVCVVMASGGYPEVMKNKVIQGLDKVNGHCHVIHAGTKQDNNQLLTNGGRVLGVVGQHSELKRNFNNLQCCQKHHLRQCLSS